MFEAARGTPSCDWAEEGDETAMYVEAFTTSDVSGTKSDTDDHQNSSSQVDTHQETLGTEELRGGSLDNKHIREWLFQQGSYARPPTSKRATGGLRLLVLSRQKYHPLDFPISFDTFNLIVETFELPSATLPSFASDSGTQSRYLRFSGSGETKRLEQISVITKTPQKSEIGNNGLSLTYDLRTRVTSAILYGFSLHLDDSPRYDPHAIQPGLLRLLRDAHAAWTHPLCLPSVLIADHMRRTKLFCDFGSAMSETWAIEHELGVTFVGRNLTTIPSDTMTAGGRAVKNARAAQRSGTLRIASIGRTKAEELTVRINTHSTRIIFVSRVVKWNAVGTEFLLGLLSSLAPLFERADHLGSAGEQHADALAATFEAQQRALLELLEYNAQLAESVAGHVHGVQQRVTQQLNTLYTVTAQMDNALSARIAASSGRDSVSMKILAFITALFLPGTFVATLFSMGMFDWQYSSSSNSSSNLGGGSGGESRVVSSRFWIYWAVSVPLTAITLIGWAIWWKVEMGRYKLAFAEAMRDAEETGGDAVVGRQGERRTFGRRVSERLGRVNKREKEV